MEHPTPSEVQHLRKAHRMTQTAFGQIVHASAAAVQSWESGRRACPVNTWELLLVFFGEQAPRQQQPGARPREEVARLQYDLEMARSQITRLHGLIKSINALTQS